MHHCDVHMWELMGPRTCVLTCGKSGSIPSKRSDSFMSQVRALQELRGSDWSGGKERERKVVYTVQHVRQDAGRQVKAFNVKATTRGVPVHYCANMHILC